MTRQTKLKTGGTTSINKQGIDKKIDPLHTEKPE